MELDMCIYMVYIMAVLCVIVTNCDNNETVLMNRLLDKYDLRARPVSHDNETVDIELEMHILKLQEVHTKNQYISVLGWVNVHWTDPRLRWNIDEFPGLDYIAIPATDMWLPTFVLANSASDYLYNEFWYSLFKAQVHSNGKVKWTPGGIFTADCPIEVDFFPFDEQTCHFRFENWVYTGEKVNLSYTTAAQDTLLRYYSVKNGQWDIVDTVVFRKDKTFMGSQPYPRVYFGLHLKRKPLFYITNIILLSVLIATLVLFIFKLPAESGERISMGVTLLLAFSVFILMINDSIPETSSAVPIIIVYLICFMALSTLGICESVFVLYCYHHNGEARPPYCFRLVFFRLMKCKISEDDKLTEKERCVKEWQDLSRQIDIFCFWLFVTAFVVLVMVLLVIVPVSFGNKRIEESVITWQDM